LWKDRVDLSHCLGHDFVGPLAAALVSDHRYFSFRFVEPRR
jgi:hypothetical protein